MLSSLLPPPRSGRSSCQVSCRFTHPLVLLLDQRQISCRFAPAGISTTIPPGFVLPSRRPSRPSQAASHASCPVLRPPRPSVRGPLLPSRRPQALHPSTPPQPPGDPSAGRRPKIREPGGRALQPRPPPSPRPRPTAAVTCLHGSDLAPSTRPFRHGDAQQPQRLESRPHRLAGSAQRLRDGLECALPHPFPGADWELFTSITSLAGTMVVADYGHSAYHVFRPGGELDRMVRFPSELEQEISGPEMTLPGNMRTYLLRAEAGGTLLGYPYRTLSSSGGETPDGGFPIRQNRATAPECSSG